MLISTLRYSLCLFIFIYAAANGKAQTAQISLGPNSAKQVWYSLPKGETASAPAAEWDIAFEIQGFTASIITNSAQGVMLWVVPGKEAGEDNFNAVDTNGIGSWPALYNSDTSWSYGAFNQNLTSEFDLGWGVYNMATHFVSGDSIYVIRLTDGSYRKLWILNLAGGTYNFRYANLDNSGEMSGALPKTAYPGRNFAYYSLSANKVLDREPASEDWDLLFTKYTTFIPSAYGVTGVLHNKNVQVAEAKGVDRNTVTHGSYTFSPEINTIGYDWKRFDMNSNSYILSDSTVYFVRRANGEIWKLHFTGFSGGSQGNISFEQEQLQSTGVYDESGNTEAVASVYPNPSNGGNITLVYSCDKASSNAFLTVHDLTGQTLLSQSLTTAPGLQQAFINTESLPAGTYMAVLQLGNTCLRQSITVIR